MASRPPQRPPQRPSAPPSRTPSRPAHRGPAPAAAARPGASASAEVHPLSEAELDQLQALLDQVPAPLEPLDVSMLDGFLCGLLVQPLRVPEARWLPFVTDADGRPLPAGFSAGAIHAFARRRHAELDAAIARRDWFDPWVFELDLDPEDAPDEDIDTPPEVQAVYPWVAGFVTALDQFPALMERSGPALNDALVLLYRHLDADDLEDADDILEAIEQLEPPEDLGVAVEELVRATLLLADIGRPLAARPGPARPAGRPTGRRPR